MDFLIQSLRTIFYSLDSIIYSLIPSVYALLIQITRTSIFTQHEINLFAKRVYALIGVFMLFKVTISIINYVINPDDFSDKEKGFTNIIKRIILSLVMLVVAPYIFKFAYDVQGDILEENTIMNLVFGSPSGGSTPGRDTNTSNGRSSNSSYVDMAGRKIQFTLMYAFAQPNYQEFSGSNFDLMNCENTYAKDPDTYEYLFRDSSIAGRKSSYIYELNEDCWGTYNPDTDAYENNGSNGKLMQLFEDNDAGAAYQNYAQGVAQQSFSLFFRKEVIGAKSEDGRYFVNYRYGISTAVGVATLYLFLMFCVDIAVRSIQWGFLQMISPIPILSYCDPKSGKDGMFKKWLDKCKSVYLELFIRLFALYFGIYIITLVGTFRDVITGEEISMMDNWILSIFMILGVLMFVKKLPKFLSETLNLKGGEDMFKRYTTPFKTLESEALGGKAIAGLAKKPVGVAAGLAAGTAAGVAGLATGKGFHLSHLTKGMAGGLKGEKFGKNFASSYGAGKERHRQLQQMEADGLKRSDVFNEKIRTAFGRETNAERVQQLVGQGKAIQSAYDQIKSQLTSCDKDDTSLSYTYKDLSGAVHTSMRSAKTISKELEEAKKTTISRQDFTGATAEADYQAAISAQRERIANMEAELEGRINAAVAGLQNHTFSTTVASADKVVSEQTSLMNKLKGASNDLGSALDDNYAKITAADNDVVNIMKQGKGVSAQATSGQMQRYADAGKYAGGGKK